VRGLALLPLPPAFLQREWQLLLPALREPQ
jgi:hypothetical protein